MKFQPELDHLVFFEDKFFFLLFSIILLLAAEGALIQKGSHGRDDVKRVKPRFPFEHEPHQFLIPVEVAGAIFPFGLSFSDIAIVHDMENGADFLLHEDALVPPAMPQMVGALIADSDF